jgi:putative transposase
MSKNEFNPIPLIPNSVYHIFSHSVDNNNLFYENDNYNYFLKKWEQFSSKYFRTYAFCLMPNHFHLCVQALPLLSLDINNTGNISKNNSNENHYHSKQISNFLSSYTQALNKQRGRKGTLFRSTFGRVAITNVNYFKDLICYIHHNPIHHFGADVYSEWQYSSFNVYRYNEAFKFVDTTITLNRFGGMKEFLNYHDYYRLNKKFMIIKDDLESYIKKYG